ncbi:MAG: hypothetical protein AAGK97_01940 [Bacteroidota bacterium]
MSEFNQAEKINARTGERENLVSRDGKYYDSQGKEYNPDEEICDPDVAIIDETSPLDNLSNPLNSQSSIGMPPANLETKDDSFFKDAENVDYEFGKETGENVGAAVVATHTRTGDDGEELTKVEALFETKVEEDLTSPNGYKIDEISVLRVTEELDNGSTFERKYFVLKTPDVNASSLTDFEFYSGHLNVVQGEVKHKDGHTVGVSSGKWGIGFKFKDGNLGISLGETSWGWQILEQESKESHQKKVDGFQSLIDETENRFEKRIPKLSGGGVKG